MALFGGNLPASAQQKPAATDDTKQETLQEVVVTGIRYSVEKSLQLKREAVGTVDVVTAESIGKLPDKNVADALQRLPGVDISSASGTEGAFDEADRVSMRGTSPSLTQTLINGHYVATGDWFVLDQTGTVGRSVSYTLLPAEIVGRVEVNKSSEASLLEGGTAGTVNIITRKPLDFHQSLTLQGSLGAVYATQPGTKDPQFSALGNWVNADRTFGVLLQAFSETRHLRRDGQEMLGYNQFKATDPAAIAVPALAGVYYPQFIGSTFFQQKRVRNGGLVDVEWRPNDALTLDLNGFVSHLQASNLNDNYLLWMNNFAAGEAPASYTIQNNTLTSAYWTPVAGTAYTVYDQISRPNDSSSTYYGVLSGTWKASDSLTLYGELGNSEGEGKTPNQDVSETDPAVGTGAWYHLNGTTTAASWNTPGTNPTTPTPNGVPVAFGWIFGDQNIDVVDAENWAKIDATYGLKDSVFTDFKFGARYSDHDRHSWGAIGQGPGCDGGPLNWSDGPFACPDAAGSGLNPANYPTGHQNYPSDWGNGIGTGFPREIWYWTPAQLSAYNSIATYRDPLARADWSSDYGVHEKDTAVYVQADLAGERWSANAGLRFARTQEDVAINLPSACTTTSGTGDAATCTSQPNVIVTSAFGDYQTNHLGNTYNDILPSVNFKYNLTPELIARLDASETMTRPDYSSLAGAVSTTVQALNPGVCCGDGSGGNPNLKPTKSTNVDAGMEWYFGPKSMLAAEFFHMSLKDYVAFGTYQTTIFTQNNNTPANQIGFQGLYSITAPFNADARVDGIELSYVQSFLTYWGVETNFTYADGKQTSNIPAGGTDQMVGTSKDTANAIVFFEDKGFSARVAYTYRSSFFDGLDRSTAFTQQGVGTLAASLDYAINDSVEISLDGLNLNNPEYKYYALGTYQPRSFYRNGSQYYLNLRVKL
jgi:iron complex outermembrane receptor protein